ncbi:MAG: serine/threonine protein kinase [Chlamydiales bacterium]|jgi:serine/threonine protein kinase
MVSVSFGAISVLAVAFLTLALPVLVLWTVFKVVQGGAWVVANLFKLVRGFVRHIFAFVRGSALDMLHFVGGLLTACVILPLAILNVIIGRWSSAGHYGRALEDELMSAGVCLYRFALGNPIRLMGLGVLTDGLERRLPELVARAPRERRRRTRSDFPGYKITGDLPPGGSGARLFLAKPSSDKVASFRNKGFPDPGKVVIKSFALGDGSTLPQIVRESRALEAAGRLGLVLEHDLSSDRFHYVMPFVPGDDLDIVTRRAHTEAGAQGLTDEGVRQILEYASDLLETLEHFHDGGLWHKDIKPTNLIVSSDRVHLVDLGLVTPLESGMTLTTHGTEYFRDPELVRLALKGVKVHEVDGVKFDLYSAGAVLYSMIENSFPAHGSLSRITKRCPDAVQWIVRRAMADMKGRYGSAGEMLADLRVALAARDPFSVRPAELPSVKGGVSAEAPSSAFRPGPPPIPQPAPRESLFASFAARRAAFRPWSRRSGRVSTAPVSKTGPAGVRRRTRRHTMAAAFLACFFGMFVAASSGLFLDGEPRSGSHAAPRVASFLERVGERARGVARRAGAPIPPEVETRQESSVERMWARRLRPELPVLEQDGSSQGRTVLIVEELPPTADERILPGLQACLRERGYNITGLAGVGPQDGSDVAWSAGARRAVGLSDPTDAQALERLQSFVDGSSPELGAVLWVSQDSGDGHVLYHLVKRTARKAAVPSEIVFSTR